MARLLTIAAMLPFGKCTDITIEVQSGGLTREAVLHIPKGATGKVPLVVDSHAWGSMATAEALLTDFSTVGDREGFAVVYPRGYDLGQPLAPIPTLPLPGGVGYSFNAGGCCPHASSRKRGDVQFIRELVAYVVANLPKETKGAMEIDETRVYATGMSNGGFFTNRLSCEARDLFAAIAPVSGILLNGSSPEWGGDPFSCHTHTPPLPVLHFHGTADIAVPWTGNPLFGFPSLPNYLATRLRLNGLSAEDKGSVTYKNGLVTCTAHGPAASNVTLCRIELGGHAWPGSHYLCAPVPPFQCNHDIDATEQIWAFFKRYSLLKTTTVVV